MPLELRESEDMATSAWARILLTGKPKVSGKTTLIGTTAPGPVLIINCDGSDAAFPAKRAGGKFTYLDVSTAEELNEAVVMACKLCNEDKFRTVCLDTLTLLVNVILVPQFRWRFRNEKDVGYATYRESGFASIRAIKQLININAHLFITAHVKEGELNIQGSLREDVPGLVHDVVHLSVDGKGNRKLEVSGRRIAEPITCEANATKLLETLGYTP